MSDIWQGLYFKNKHQSDMCYKEIGSLCLQLRHCWDGMCDHFKKEGNLHFGPLLISKYQCGF